MVGGKTADQILRVDGKGCFVEFMSGMFQPLKPGKLGKVLMNFATYNEQTNAQTCLIPIYIDIPKFCALTDDIRFGRLKTLAAKEKAAVANGEKKYEESIWQDLGGTSAKILKMQGKSRPDGMSESRVFDIIPARKENTYLLRATRGAGEEATQGIIKPKINYSDKNSYQQIQIPVSEEDLRAIAKTIDMYIQAYYTSQWMNGAFVKENNTNSNTGNTQPNNNTRPNNGQNNNNRQQTNNSQPTNQNRQAGNQQNNRTQQAAQQNTQQSAQTSQPQARSGYGNVTDFKRNNNQQANNQPAENTQGQNVGNISDEEEFPFQSAI